MPFKSAAQERYMFAAHPDIANKWKTEHPKNAAQMLKGTKPNGAPKATKAPGISKFSAWEKLNK